MADEAAPVATGIFNETKAPEAKPAAEAAPAAEQAPVKVDPFAPKFAALTRLDRDIKAKQAAFQAERKAFEAEKAEMLKQREEMSKINTDYKTKLKADPLSFLTENDVQFDELVERKLNDGKMTPEKMVQQLKAELDAKYSKELEELKRSIKEKEEAEEQAKYDNTVNGFKSQISDFVTANKDTYELINAEQAQDLVFDVIETHFQETSAAGEPKVLSIEEAARAVEQHLEGEVRKKLELKKFKQTSQPQEAKDGKQTAPTLSNTMSSEVPIRGEKQMSKEESLKQAAKLIRWDA
jgi:hypothetical protein